MLRCVTPLGNMQNVEQCANSGALNPPRTATWNATAEHTVKGYRTKSPLFLPQAKGTLKKKKPPSGHWEARP